MHNNDVELRLPCQEGALGKASKLSLVKIRKSMTKERKRIKGSFLKAEKAERGKSRKVIFKERKSFLMSQEKHKVVITQKRHLLTKGGRSF